MKIIKWIGHPVIMIVIYLLLIIEGDEFGGFFMLYLMLALPHLVPYAVVAAAGLFFVVLAFNLKREKLATLFYYLVGYALMLISLFIFFSKGNKNHTFDPGVPLFTFIVFGISSMCFIVWLSSLFLHHFSKSIPANS